MTQSLNPIKVIGVGGGGSNAVNTMHQRGIEGVDFIVCNTDAQALEASPVATKVQLGRTLTDGQGAGSQPEVGKNAAIESIDEIKELLTKGTRMVFVTAGMGGGTGTGAAPVIAKVAKELGILTVGIVTIPFKFEGRRRSDQAEMGLEAMRNAVDTLLIIRNDKLRELYSGLTIGAAFSNSDDVLCTAAKGIAEVITLTGQINVDMNDVNTVMRDSGRAIMGSGKGTGEGRAEKAVREALESPLLNDHDITGARYVLLNITFSKDEILMDEIMEITDFIQEAAGQTAEVIWGYGIDPKLEDDISVTVIATGFQALEGNGPEAAEQKLWLGGGMPPQAEPPAAVAAKAPEQPYIKASESLWNAPFENRSMNAEPAMPQAQAQPLPTPQPPVTQPDAFDASTWTLKEETPTEPTESMPTLFSEPIAPTAPIAPIAWNAPLNPEPPQEEATVRFNLPMDEEEAPETAFQHDPSEWTTTPEPKGISETPANPNGFVIRTVNSQPEPTPRTDSRATDTQDRQAERNKRLAMLTSKIKSPNGVKDLEDVPAYKRRMVQLDEVVPSSARTVGQYSLNTEVDEDGHAHTTFTKNGFLDDQVD